MIRGHKNKKRQRTFDPLDPNPRGRSQARGNNTMSRGGRGYMSPGDVLKHNRRNNVSREDLLKTSGMSSSSSMSMSTIPSVRPSSSSSSFPGEWQAVRDPSSGDTYYYNSRTGQTQWEPPTISKPTPPSNTVVASNENWQAVTDPSSGDTYYFNKITGKTQWEPPHKKSTLDANSSSSSNVAIKSNVVPKPSSPSPSSSKDIKKNPAIFEVGERVVYTKRNFAAIVVAVHRDDAEGVYYTIRAEEDSREIQTIEKYLSPREEEEKKEEEQEPELPPDIAEFVNVVQKYVLKQRDVHGGKPPKGYIESMVDVYLNAPPNGRETMLRDLRALVESGDNKKESVVALTAPTALNEEEKKKKSPVVGVGNGLVSGDYGSSSEDED